MPSASTSPSSAPNSCSAFGLAIENACCESAGMNVADGFVLPEAKGGVDWWSPNVLGKDFDFAVQKCGVGIPCLTPFTPNETIVRGGTYYSYQPGNGVIEYAAERKIVLATRHEDVMEVLKRDLDFLIAPVNAERMEQVNGPFILGMDRFGMEHIHPDELRIHTLLALLESGYADRIVLFTQPPGQGKPRLSFLRDLLAELPQNQSLVLQFDQASGSDVAQPAEIDVRRDVRGARSRAVPRPPGRRAPRGPAPAPGARASRWPRRRRRVDGPARCVLQRSCRW